jgi:hypothetical protein
VRFVNGGMGILTLVSVSHVSWSLDDVVAWLTI